MAIKRKEITKFDKGLINEIEPQSIEDGAASNEKNWLTKQDRIELRRGFGVLGGENSGTDKITGLAVGRRADGTEIPLRTWGTKVEYYNSTTNAWVEVGSDLLGSGADGEDISITNYHNLAGAWAYLSSPNSDIFKIPMANPDSAKTLSSTTFRGYIKAKQGRMFLWNRLDTRKRKDETGLYMSFIDKDDISDYTETTGEVIDTGDGSETTFTNTLTTITAVKTVFGVEVTDGTETFADNYNGVLVGDAGGTGTINYATGAISVTFNTAPTNLQDITARYYTEDCTTQGIADFTIAAVAGEAKVLRQDDGGGKTQNVFSINNVEYCMHEKKTWALTVSDDDTNATNYIYRDRVGIPNWRAGVETGDGIYYVDDTDQNKPRFRVLRIPEGTTEVLPFSISDKINLEDYRFNLAATIEWGDFILFACRHKKYSYNQTVFIYNKRYKLFDKLDYLVSNFAIYNGALIAGDSLSNNVYTLFSGLDDDDSNINNFWESKLDDLQVDNLKKVKRLVIQGNIGASQTIKVSASFDRDAYVELGTIVGSGSYVDTSQSVNIGATTLGQEEVGGGGDGLIAHNYIRELEIKQGKFDEIKLKFEAQDIGWADISYIQFKDVRLKERRVPNRYRT